MCRVANSLISPDSNGIGDWLGFRVLTNLEQIASVFVTQNLANSSSICNMNLTIGTKKIHLC